MTDTTDPVLYFVDGSSWQGDTVDLSQLPKRYAGVIWKATEGTTYTNPNFRSVQQQARDLGLLFASYFWPRFKDGKLEDQVAHYADVVGDVRPGEWGAVDVEEPDSGAACNADSVYHVCDLAAKFLQADPLLYTYWSFSLEHGLQHDSNLAAFPLWYAYDPNSVAVWPLPGWDHVTMHQFNWSAAVPGMTGNVDESRFYGTRADWYALAKRDASVSALSDGTQDANRALLFSVLAHDHPSTEPARYLGALQQEGTLDGVERVAVYEKGVYNTWKGQVYAMQPALYQQCLTNGRLQLWS